MDTRLRFQERGGLARLASIGLARSTRQRASLCLQRDVRYDVSFRSRDAENVVNLDDEAVVVV